MSNKALLVILSIFIFHSAFTQIFEKKETFTGINQLDNTMGIAVADYDGDNDLDLFVVAKRDYSEDTLSTWSRLFKNNGDGTFEDVTIAAGFNQLYDYNEADPGWQYGVKMGVSWGDYDNDGFPDLFLTNYHRVQLFHNEGDGTFQEVTISAGFPVQDSCYNTTALWWDFNKDSWLDIYVARWGGCEQNRFYENNGDGTFTDKTTTLDIGSQYRETWMTIPIDANQDGLWDLYLANDFRPNELFIQNDDYTFTNQALPYKASYDGNEMGMTIGDYNNNGEFDIYITNIGVNRFLTPNGSEYKNLAQSQKISFTFWGWAAQFADFDLDGDEDLFVTNGYQNDQIFFPVFKENFLFNNLFIEGEGKFEDTSAENQVDIKSNSMGLCVFDYDNDGDQDAIVSNMDAPPFIYENQAANSSNNESNWVTFQLKGTVSNRDGLGSQVKIRAEGQFQQRLYYGANLFAQNLQGVHFGLGNATTIDSLEIIWDSGIREKYFDLTTNKIYKIEEKGCLNILDDQQFIAVDCQRLVALEAIETAPQSILFPNPSTAKEEIILTNTSFKQAFKVIDVQGRTISFNSNYDFNTQSTTLSFPQLDAGIYFIISGKQSWKLVILL